MAVKFHRSVDAWRMVLLKSFATNRRETKFLNDMVLRIVSIVTGPVYSRSISKFAKILENPVRYVLNQLLVENL